MSESMWIEQALDWISANRFRLLVTLLGFCVFFLVRRLSQPKIQNSVDASGLNQQTATKASHLVWIGSSLLLGVAMLFVWGVDIQHILIIGTSAITLLGVALFANWSLLSSITAFVVLLIHPSYRRGNYLRIINLDNYYEGYISEINLFHTKLITDEREVFLYPNNALLTAPVMINPRQHWKSAGKLVAPPPVVTPQPSNPLAEPPQD